MRIGVDLRPLQTAHRGAGIGTYTYHLVRHLMQLENTDEWRYFALDGVPVPGFEIFDTVRIRRPPSSHIAFWEQTLLPIDMWRSRLDVFHATGALTQVWELGVPLVQPCPVVVTVQDLHPFIIPHFRFIADARAFGWQIKALRKAAGLIAVSNNTRQDMARYADIPPERIDVIPMAPGEHFHIMEPSVAENLLRPYNLLDPFVLYVGNYNVHKNIELLVEAWNRLPRSVHLALVGRRETYPASLTDRLSGAGKEDRVRFISGLQNESPELVALYNRAALFVFPSLYEGFGLPVVEAMRCGCPVIASRRGSLPEVVQDAGVLIEPEDVEGLTEAMQRILDDGGWRNTLIRQGLEHVKKFSWPNTAERTMEIYRKAAGKG
ncbi:MAG: glycosyltransferase family 4 protein [candidate division Zixibacteria bacterium]|nr:glycosyltransferase family 4 protein [candidate division Zixibacteria bacterium]